MPKSSTHWPSGIFSSRSLLAPAILWRAFEQSGGPLLVTDGDNRIVAANEAFCRMSGYDFDELSGQDPAMLASHRTPTEQMQALWASLRAGENWEGEIWNKHKDGSLYRRLLKVSALHDDEKRTVHYVASFSEMETDQEASRRLAFLAYHDPLTNLPNRLAFESQLKQTLSLCERSGSSLALMIIDLDNFKNINDTLGHHVGDELLREVSTRLRNSIRASDLVARLGGDEFVVVLPRTDGPQTAARVALKIQSNLADSYDVAGHILYATPSIGISLFPDDGSDGSTLMRNADSAMYHAKNAGRNNHQFYAKHMNEAAGERLRMESELRRAVAAISPGHSEFSLHFQPQIEAASGRIVGLEALLRWKNQVFGQVSPARMIPIAEETGLIQPLGDWIIWESCRLTAQLRQRGIADVRVAINISAQQLRHDNLLLLIQGALACYDLSPGDIELEITESTAMQNPETTLEILERLYAMGIMMSIDDFGTGYSSLAYLKHLPINRLKLDQSFVRDMVNDRNDAAICAATIALGHNLGLEMIAEGVETETQRKHLGALKCDILQGYLFSKPLPYDEIVAYLEKWQDAAKPGV